MSDEVEGIHSFSPGQLEKFVLAFKSITRDLAEMHSASGTYPDESAIQNVIEVGATDDADVNRELSVWVKLYTMSQRVGRSLRDQAGVPLSR